MRSGHGGCGDYGVQGTAGDGREFYRGSGPDVEGTGLGLSIAAEAARQMGGSLQVDSQPGRVTTFSAWIPDDHTRPAG